jgi:zinc/manganese transport system substrate-binding protein
MQKMRKYIASALMLATAVTGAQAQDKIKAIASFSIIADLVKQIGGDYVAVTSLVGPNADMHNFQPSPSDSKRIADAQLVVINGLGLEGWADRLIKASGYRGARLVASSGIKALPGGGEHGRYDPHAWQKVANVKVYISNIRAALAEVDPAHKTDYERATTNYLKQLDALETEIKAAFDGIPKPQRRIITSHEAFTYYGDAYNIEFLAPQGITETSAPSAKNVAQLIRQIKREKIKAVFVENISSQQLMNRIASETGAIVGGTLYSDALSEPSGSAATYIEMMRHNTRLIATALRQGKP